VTRIIAVANQKGGVGKTTTAINLSAALADLGHFTLLADMDPQAHATHGMGLDPGTLPLTLFHFLTGDASLADVLQPTASERLYVAPAGMDLAFADEALASVDGRDLRLKRGLAEVQLLFDFVVIDSPAQLNLLTINTMAAATEVLVPAHSQHYSQVGLASPLSTVTMLRNLVNPNLGVSGILITQFDKRSALHRRTVEQLRATPPGGVKVLETVIPHGLRAQHAAELRLPVGQAFPHSPVARAYAELAAELVLAGPAQVPARNTRQHTGLSRSVSLGRGAVGGSVSSAAWAEFRRLTIGNGAAASAPRELSASGALGPNNGSPSAAQYVDIRPLRITELLRGSLGRGITRILTQSLLLALRDDLARLEATGADQRPSPPDEADTLHAQVAQVQPSTG